MNSQVSIGDLKTTLSVLENLKKEYAENGRFVSKAVMSSAYRILTHELDAKKGGP